MEEVEAAKLQKRRRTPAELNEFMSNWRTFRIGHPTRLREAVKKIPLGIWATIFEKTSDLESNIRFLTIMRENHESQNLHFLSMALGYFLFSEYPEIQRVFLFDANKRDALIPLIREKLSHRQMISETEVDDAKLRDQINNLITASNQQTFFVTNESLQLRFFLERLNFILEKTQSLPITNLTEQARRNFLKMLIIVMAGGISGFALMCSAIPGLIYQDATGFPLLFTGAMLLGLSSLVYFSERSDVRGRAARLGSSMSQCFRNCRHSEIPEERAPLLINNSNNDPDPLAENEAEMYAFSIQSNRPG